MQAIEDDVRAAVPASIREGRRARLKEIANAAKAKGLPHERPVALVRNLIEKGLASGELDVLPASGVRTYSLDDTVSLLLACRLVTDLKIMPNRAADLVLDYHRRRGRFAGSQALDELMKVALNRFHRHIAGRLVGAVLSTLLGDELEPGTIVFVDTAPDGVAVTEAWAEGRLRERVKRPGAGLLAMVGETGEIFFVRALSERVLDRRAFWPTRVEGTPAYVIVVAARGDRAQHSSARDHVEHSDLGRRLLKAVLSGFKTLEESAVRQLPKDRVALDPSAELTLWLATVFATIVAAPDAPATAHCLILTPQPDPQTGKPLLRVVASSDEPPWDSHPDDRVYLRPGQLLSAYGALVNVTLTVPRADPPFDQLVSQLGAERKQLDDKTPSCVSIPIPSRDGSSSAALYVYIPAAPESLPDIVRMLNVLAPAVGELLQRNLDAANTTRFAAEAMTIKYHTDGLPAALERGLTELLEIDEAMQRPREPDARVAFVVLDAGSAGSPLNRHAPTWLRAQLGYITPRVFLTPWMRRGAEAMDLHDAVCGALPGGATLLMVPAILRKQELDILRDALPKTLNALPSGVTESGEGITRLNIWLMDVRWERVAAARSGGTLKDFVDNNVIGQASSAARVLKNIIDAYTFGYVRGRWDDALESALAGLSIERRNPYLLRRAAEFSLFMDDFIGAERYAERALEADDQSVTAHCLLGDARIGQGRLEKALSAFKDAAQLEPAHPLPEYSAAFGRLSIATLLRFAGAERARVLAHGEKISPPRPLAELRQELRNVESHCTSLSASAAIGFRKARQLLVEWVTPGPQEVRKLQEAAAAFGLFQTALVAEDPDSAIQSLLKASEISPRDSLLQRQLILARMWKNATLVQRLFLEYGAAPAAPPP